MTDSNGNKDYSIPKGHSHFKHVELTDLSWLFMKERCPHQVTTYPRTVALSFVVEELGDE